MHIDTSASALERPAPVTKIGSGFYVIWSTQFASMFGSQLTAFALGIWLFQKTGSALSFTQFILSSTLPALLLLPWGGVIADRWSKRVVLASAELVAVACTAAMAMLFRLGNVQVWELYALQSILSLSIGIQGPTASAAITSMVPKAHYGRASGMYQIATAISQLAAPLLAALLLGRVGITGILVFDLLTFTIALVGVLGATIPSAIIGHADGTGAAIPSPPRNALNDVRWAFKFLGERPSMATVFVYRIIGAMFTGMVLVLIGPLVLSQHSEKVFAMVSTSGAIGALSSGLLLVAWGGLKKWTPRVLLFNVVQGLAIAQAGLTRSAPVLCGCAFLVMLCSSTLAGCTSAVWRRKVPPDRQGNFAAFQQAVGLTILPLSACIGGLLAQCVFEPALVSNGTWMDAFVPWFGTSAGRGTRFLFFAMGTLAVLVALAALCDRRVHRVDSDVPDAV